MKSFMVVVLVVCTATFGAALQCYTCSSNNLYIPGVGVRDTCADPLNTTSTAVADCLPDSSCMKLVAEVNDLITTIRSCALGVQPTGCTVSPYGSRICYCSDDLCNGSSMVN